QSRPLDHITLDAILIEAGRDLARINCIPVTGYGRISRDEGDARLSAPHPNYRADALEHWEDDLSYLAENTVLDGGEIARLRSLPSRHGRWLDTRSSLLAHGDFDTTAIFQHDGRYTGIIDFGEVRGADRWYDLGHFHLCDGEYLPAVNMRPLVRGYSEVTPLTRNCGRRICLASVLINVRALSRSLRRRPPDRFTRRQVAVLRADLAMLDA
ncbi:MAG: phosphotransferase, partial [Ktedonobacterales bacterium]